MKKIILAIAAILFMGELTATAQTRTTVSINGMKGSDFESIDSTKYRITYEGKWVINPSSHTSIRKARCDSTLVIR